MPFLLYGVSRGGAWKGRATTREIVRMLELVPSKFDEERLLLVSPEVANVLAAIII